MQVVSLWIDIIHSGRGMLHYLSIAEERRGSIIDLHRLQDVRSRIGVDVWVYPWRYFSSDEAAEEVSEEMVNILG